MKADLSTPILNLDGVQAETATVHSICEMALQAQLRGDDELDLKAKVAIFRLAQKIHPGGTIDLTAEELVLLKDRVGRGFHPLVVGRVLEVLDPAALAA